MAVWVVAIGHSLGVHWRMLTSKRVVRCLARWHSTTFACEDAMPMSAPSRRAPSSLPPSSSSTFPNSHSAPVLVSRAIHLPPVSHRPHILIPTTYPRSSLASCHRPDPLFDQSSCILDLQCSHTIIARPAYHTRQPCHFHALNLSTAYRSEPIGHFNHGLTTIVTHTIRLQYHHRI